MLTGRERMGSHICLLVIMAAALLGGCGVPRDTAYSAGDDSLGGELPPEDADTGLDENSAFNPYPIWFGLDGVLELTDGAVDVEASEVVVTLWTEELQAPVCEATVAVAAADPVDPDPALHAMWEVTLETGSDCAQYGWPRSFDLGIGEPDVALAPAAAASDLAWQALYGLYVSAGGPLYIYGVAGLDAHFQGEAEATAPLADGPYVLKSLHLLPL